MMILKFISGSFGKAQAISALNRNRPKINFTMTVSDPCDSILTAPPGIIAGVKSLLPLDAITHECVLPFSH